MANELEERISLAGHRAEALADATERVLHSLRTTPPTIEDVLTGTVGRHVARLDFKSLDACIRECASLTKAGDAEFMMRARPHSLIAWLDTLRALREQAEVFRPYLPKESRAA